MRAARHMILLFIVGLVGCSYSDIVSRESGEYNVTYETATNDLLLTNVLRARDELPLYFAALSDLKGSLTQMEGFSLPIPFGPGKIATGKKYVDTLTGSLSNAPNFDIAPLDTQDFTQGMLTPIALELAQYYWNRNDLPQWLLANLFIAKIEVTRSCPSFAPQPDGVETAHFAPSQDLLSDPRATCQRDPVEVLENDPNDSDKQLRFERYIRTWLNPGDADPRRQAFFYTYSKSEQQGPDFAGSAIKLADLAGLQAKQASGPSGSATPSPAGPTLRLVADKNHKGQYQLKSITQAVTICPPRLLSLAEAAQTADLASAAISLNSKSAGTEPFEKQTAACPLPQIIGHPGDPAKILPALLGAPPKGKAAPAGAATGQPTITIYQRSPSEMFGYLGAILRANDRASKFGCPAGNPVGFYASRGSGTGDAAIALDYHDATYHIDRAQGLGGVTDQCGNYPSGRIDYTMKVIAMLNQLVNLSKNASEIPVIKSVTVTPQ